MKFSDWFRRKSPLQLALQRGVENGRLDDEIRELGEVVVKNRHDAEAICDVLAGIAQGEVPLGEFSSALRVIAGLFQKIESSECIWHRRGNIDMARDLMIECLRHTLREAGEASGSDIQFHERIYQRQLQDFGRIFGDVVTLRDLGLPQTTLNGRR